MSEALNNLAIPLIWFLYVEYWLINRGVTLNYTLIFKIIPSLNPVTYNRLRIFVSEMNRLDNCTFEYFPET